MSSSDKIKDALIAAFPGTSAKDWKRRSKKKVGASTERIFENTISGDEVTTLEDASGNVTVAGFQIATSSPASQPSAPPPIAASSVPSKVDRNSIVPGSRWRLKRDVQITGWVERPEYTKAVRAGIEGIRSSAQQALINQMIKDETRYICVPTMTIKAGAEFTVVAKMMKSNYWASTGQAKHQTDGMLIPAEFADKSLVDIVPEHVRHVRSYHDYRDKMLTAVLTRSAMPEVNVVSLPFTQVIDAVEPLEIPETPIFVLRDAATGELFGGWKTKKTQELYGGKVHYAVNSIIGDPKMVTKLSSAKKYSTESAAKASIREFVGYNEGLDNSVSESGPYWAMGGSKAMDLPLTWELVSFDKATGRELRVIDVQKWLKELFRLRELTVRFGTAVRTVYKKAEGKGFDSIVVFSSRSRGISFSGQHYDEVTPFDHQEDRTIVRQIETAAKNISGKSLKAKTDAHIAYAVNRTDAFALQLGFAHQKVEVLVYDYETLEEVVAQT